MSSHGQEPIGLDRRARLRIASMLLRRSVLEWVRQRRAPWWVIGALVRLLRGTGVRRSAALLAAAGQRSCPHEDLRTVFGGLAAQLIDVLRAEPPTNRQRDLRLVGSRLCVLKAPVGPNEPGVLHVKFSEVIAALPDLLDLKVLSRQYRLVLEPSWTGLCDPGILRYTSLPRSTIVMAPDACDFEFIRRVGRGLIPVPVGPSDWVDPRAAEPFLGLPKTYDIVMNANWAPWKRHHVLFREMRRGGVDWRVALIGAEWDGGTRQSIMQLAAYYGVDSQIDIYEKVPFDKVMEVVCRSRCSVLLSLKEGSNRALAESMFCDVPVIALREHVGGIRKNIGPETGRLVDEMDLVPAIESLRKRAENNSPRRWAEAHISCLRSSQLLNEALAGLATVAGEEWTADIAARSNSPESRYVDPQDHERLVSFNRAIVNRIMGNGADNDTAQ